MRNNYKTGTKEMTDEQVLDAVQYHHKYLENDRMKIVGVSHLTKSCYYENEAKKRGYTEEQITDYCNKKDIEEFTIACNECGHIKEINIPCDCGCHN